MGPELVFLLRLFGLGAIILGVDIYVSIRAAKATREPESKYRRYKPALDKIYGGDRATKR